MAKCFKINNLKIAVMICKSNINKTIILLFAFLSGFISASSSFAKSYQVGIALSAFDANQWGVMPGDTIIIEPGKRKILRISNVLGDSLNYVLIRNGNGDVIIENDDLFYGLAMSNCKFFRLTGSVQNDSCYGIRILKTGKGASGLGLAELSSNYEVDHIEIANTGFAGIFALSQPTCDLSANKGFFEQRNCIIRNTYIHDTCGEGMYIGHSFYTGYTIKCDGEDTKLFPHEIKGLKVYDNLVVNAGYDGIQICSAVEGTEVYNNRIINYGVANEIMQHSGIQIGAGTKLRCYNNQMLNGSGTGIVMMGLADSYIYNNLIVNAGKNFFPDDLALRIYGIFVDDRLTYPGTSQYILNNTIISSKADGIRFISKLSSKNMIVNNMIVSPGANYSYSSSDSKFIYLPNGVDVQCLNNYYSNFIFPDALAGGVQSIVDFLKNFPVADKGVSVSEYGVMSDMTGVARSISPTIGAFEFPANNTVYNVKREDLNFIQNTESGVVMIENKSEEHLRRFSVFDLTGKKILEIPMNEPRFFMINLKVYLKKGIYILSIDRFSNSFSHKFIVSSY